MGPQSGWIARLRTAVRAVLQDTMGGDMAVLLDLPASVIRSDMEDIIEEFLERVGASVDTGTAWPGVWLLLNRWLEGGIIVPDAWSPERLRRGFFSTGWTEVFV